MVREMVGEQVIAVFDFDDTLITKDSFTDFFLSNGSLKKKIISGIKFFPTYIKFQIHLISNSQAKQLLLSILFAGTTTEEFRRICNRYADRLDQLTESLAIERVRWHQGKGHEVVIVSASIKEWIEPWARRHGIKNVIATELETKGGIITGKFSTPYCYGPEKPKQFLERFPNMDEYKIFFYGDGKSDREMVKIADVVFIKRFN